MNPRQVEAATVLRRLHLMRELLDGLESMSPVSAAKLQENLIVRLAAERALCQLVDTATDINQHIASASGQRPISEYRESFDSAARVGLIDSELAAALKSSVGLRNILVHEYVNVDLTLIAQSAKEAIDTYGKYVKAVADYLTSHSTF